MVTLFICFFIFFFTLFIFSQDDFIFLRKNIPMERVFNVAFIVGLSGLFVARLFFVIFHFSPQYLHPLVFLVFPYFPGLSIFGGIAGGLSVLFLYSLYRRLPVGRFFDFFSFSFLLSSTGGLLIEEVVRLLGKKTFVLSNMVSPILFTILSLVFIFFLLPMHKRGELKEGSLGLLFLLSFSVLFLIAETLSVSQKLFFDLTPESLLVIPILIASTVLFIRRENFFSFF